MMVVTAAFSASKTAALKAYGVICEEVVGMKDDAKEHGMPSSLDRVLSNHPRGLSPIRQ